MVVAALASLFLITVGRKRPMVARMGCGALLLTVALWQGQGALGDGPPLDVPLPRQAGPIQQLRVLTEPAWTPLGHRFEAQWLRRCPPPAVHGHCFARWGTLRIDVKGRRVVVQRGDVLQISAFTSPPPGYGNPGGADTAASWQRQQQWGSVHVADSGRIAVLSHDPAWLNQLIVAVGRWRRALGLRVTEVLPEQQAAVVGAIALGDRATDWPELNAWLRETGTAHVLAVSGSHLAIVVAGLRWMLRWAVRRMGPTLLRRAPLAQWVLVPTLVLAWTYTLLTGAAAATVRAAWMLTALLVAEVARRRADVWEVLGLAVLAMVAVDETAVDDLGLQLSVAGVAGLVLSVGEPNAGRLPALRALWRASVGAWAATAPVCLARLGSLAWLSVVANAVMVPYAAVLLPVGLGVLALCQAGDDSASVAMAQWLAHWAVAPLAWVVQHTVYQWPVAHVAGWVAAALAAFAALLGAALLWGQRWTLRAALAGMLVIALALIDRQGRAVPFDGVRVTFLDVGHGDAAVVQTGDGRNWLVDAGGEVGDGGRVGALAVVPALWALGVQRLDRVVLSHAHPDHENGLVAVLRHFAVDQFWFNGQPAAGAEHTAVLAALDPVRADLTRYRVTPVVEGPLTTQLIWPTAALAPWSPGLDHNDNSLVLLLRVGRAKLLLSGDIEAKAEALLAQKGLVEFVDVLKVPHHGSHTSSTPGWLDGVAPRMAVVSARPWGQLPFPHGDVVARYRNRGTPLWRTAEGAVTVQLRPDVITVTQGARMAQWSPVGE